MKIVANDYKEKEVMKILREWTGKKQPDFGKDIGLSGMTVQGYERGTRRYTFETLMKIAKKYGSGYNIEIRDFWPLELKKNKDSLIYKILYAVFDLTETWAFKRAEHIICTLPYGSNYCIDTGKSGKEKFTYIGQPLDCAFYDKCAEKKEYLLPGEIKDFIKDSFYCVFSGYYMKYEGVNQMLYSACELEKEGLPIKFVFVGSGEEKENMQKFPHMLLNFRRLRNYSAVLYADRNKGGNRREKSNKKTRLINIGWCRDKK